MSKTTIQKKLVRSSLATLVPAFLAVTLVVVAIQVVVSRINLGETEKSIQASLQAKGKVLVTNNSQALMGMVADNAFTQVQELVSKTVQADPDIAYGVFMDKELMPWVNADKGNPEGKAAEPKALSDSTSVWAATQGKLGMKVVNWNGGRVFEFAAPVVVGGEQLGTIRYAFSTKQMDAAVLQARNGALKSGILIVVLLIALGGGALWASFVSVRSQSRKLVKPLSDLQVAAGIIGGGDYGTPVTVESDDEIGDLAQGFEAMRLTVKRYTDHLEELVDEKMRQVRDILENIEQGLFIVNFDGTINPEYSKAANEIMGVEDISKSTLGDIFKVPDIQMDDWTAWFNLVEKRHKVMRWDKLSKLAPIVELEVGLAEEEKRYVRISYQKVFDKSGELSKIMALAQDITEARRIERIVAEEKERHENEVKTILGLVNNLPEVIQDFFHDLETRMASLKTKVEELREESERARAQYPDGKRLDIPAEDIAVIFRDLHTIKGNAGTYGFDMITKLAHHAEEQLEALKPPIKERTSTTIAALQSLLEQMEEAYAEIQKTQQRLAGGGEEPILHIPEHKIEFVQALTRTITEDLEHRKVVGEEVLPLLEACGRLRDVNIVKLIEKYRNMTLRLGERLDKKLEFDIQPQTIELDPHFFAPYDEAITHILRNCVDHGIESHEARVAAGKPEHGKIQLGLLFTDDSCLFTIADDGAGMDPEKIVRKALSSGAVKAEDAAVMSDSDKLRLIFASGFSTADAVSDISGRGVGMDAALNCITQQGGRIEVKSVLGAGTTFMLHLPPRA